MPQYILRWSEEHAYQLEAANIKQAKRMWKYGVIDTSASECVRCEFIKVEKVPRELDPCNCGHSRKWHNKKVGCTASCCGDPCGCEFFDKQEK